MEILGFLVVFRRQLARHWCHELKSSSASKFLNFPPKLPFHTPSEALLNNEIIIKTQFVEEINHEIEQLPCEGYINVFLPAVPPRWDYYWGEIQAKSIILKKKYDDPAICKTIELTDFYDVEITNRSISSRPNTIRLKQNGCDDNVSLSKTLIHFDTSEMMKMWLTQLKILLEFENNWKCS